MKKILFGLLALSSLSFSAANSTNSSIPVNVMASVNYSNLNLEIVDNDGASKNSLNFTHQFSETTSGTTNSVIDTFRLKLSDGPNNIFLNSLHDITATFTDMNLSLAHHDISGSTIDTAFNPLTVDKSIFTATNIATLNSSTTIGNYSGKTTLNIQYNKVTSPILEIK